MPVSALPGDGALSLEQRRQTGYRLRRRSGHLADTPEGRTDVPATACDDRLPFPAGTRDDPATVRGRLPLRRHQLQAERRVQRPDHRYGHDRFGKTENNAPTRFPGKRPSKHEKSPPDSGGDFYDRAAAASNGACRRNLFVNFPAGSFQRILHQRDDRHRPDAAGNRRNVTAFRGHLVELDVAEQLPARFGLVARNARNAYVDDHRPVFHHVCGNEFGLAERRDYDVAAAHHLFKILRPAVAQRHRTVPAFLRQQVGDRTADDVAAADHDAMPSGGFDPVIF